MPSIDYLAKAILYLDEHTKDQKHDLENEAEFVQRLAKCPQNVLSREHVQKAIDIRLTLTSYNMAKDVFAYFSASRDLLKGAPVSVRQFIAEREHLKAPLAAYSEDALLLVLAKDSSLFERLDCTAMLERAAEAGGDRLAWQSVLMHPSVSLQQAHLHLYELLLLVYSGFLVHHASEKTGSFFKLGPLTRKGNEEVAAVVFETLPGVRPESLPTRSSDPDPSLDMTFAKNFAARLQKVAVSGTKANLPGKTKP